MTLAMLASLDCAAQSSREIGSFYRSGSVSGTIVDAENVPQMGALIQLVLPDMSLAATALTDAHGRYRIANLKPGLYRVRATAALFLPAVRAKLQVSAGSRAVVNLTLSTLLATSQWLPATRRTSEDEEDWMWALRSSSMRPVLRLADTNSGNPLSISTSAAENRSIRTQGRLSVENATGGFAHGGTHNILVLERQVRGQETTMLRADFSGSRTPYPIAPSAEVNVGWERPLAAGGMSRSVLTYTSHPELIDSRHNNGVQTMVLRNAQRFELGDAVRIEAGSALRAFNLAGNTATLEPFLNVALRPADGVVVAFTLTQARGLESLEDLDRVPAALPVAVLQGGHLRLEKGTHQAISLSGKTWKKGTVTIAAYRDRLSSPVLYGTGVLSSSSVPLLSDPTTQTFAVSGRAYDASGVRLVLKQPVLRTIVVGAEVSSGNVLANQSTSRVVLDELLNQAIVRNAVSAAIYGDGKFIRTGTALHVGYRWQPVNALTSVDFYRNERETAYLNFRLRQSLSRIPLMPAGMEAVVNVQNLLAEGYQPFLSSDGETLYLTQTPRVLQAGVAFTF